MKFPSHFYSELGKLRAWLTGWKEAGRTPPPGYEVVWQIQSFIKDVEREDNKGKEE